MCSRKRITADNWLGDLLRPILAVSSSSAVEIIDERLANDKGGIISAVVKVVEQVSESKLRELIDHFREASSGNVDVRLVRAVPPGSVVIDRAQCVVEYFRLEFAVDSRMVKHTESCVKVTHAPTGIAVRSTSHRSRIVNEQEALLVLESLLSYES
jgi:hypothetical protein